MSEIPKMETGEFKTQQYKKSWRPMPVRRKVNYARSARKPKTGGTSLLTLLTVGVAASVLLLSVALSGTTVITDAAKSVRNALNYEIDVDEALGRLKFVGNSITEVFSPQNELLIAPMENAQLRADFDATVGSIDLAGGSNSDIKAAADGIVIDTGEIDGAYYVEIDHGQGMQTKYDSLASICVENNQPLQQGDALGVTGESGVIKFALILNKQPADPAEFLKLKAE